MAKKHLSKEIILAMEQELESVDLEAQTKFNIKQTVERLFPLIQKLRSLNLEWKEISDRLQKAIHPHDTISISPKTLQNYYNEVARTHKTGKKSAPRSAKPKSNRLPSPNSMEVSAALEDTSENPGSISEIESLQINSDPTPFDLSAHLATIADESVETMALDRASSTESNEPAQHGWIDGKWVEPSFNFGSARPKT